ncbi:hypothetical protein M5D96_011333 [Drosophila gunungcola]|uniref:Secreted protein n=1 Tax=Drosophila gunungcola TaxID=103775 RepID=A0A9Q0BKU7_9MUSC|nr:hypothetical protein M5D96_011333 [Drosophila gunungcola]
MCNTLLLFLRFLWPASLATKLSIHPKVGGLSKLPLDANRLLLSVSIMFLELFWLRKFEFSSGTATAVTYKFQWPWLLDVRQDEGRKNRRIF